MVTRKTTVKSKPATKAPVEKVARKAVYPKLSAKKLAKIDAAIEDAKGSPGYEMVKALGELAKLGPYPAFKKLGIR